MMAIKRKRAFATILITLALSPLTLDAMQKEELTRVEAQIEVQMLRTVELIACKDLLQLQWLDDYNGFTLPELAHHILLFLVNDRMHDEINSVVDILKLNYPKVPTFVKKIEALHKVYGHGPTVVIVTKALQKVNKSLLDIKGSLSSSTALHIAACDKLEASVKILLAVARIFGQAKLLIDALDMEYHTASYYADEKITWFLYNY